MSRFRKVSLAMHADKKYRDLSSPHPNGKSLWVHLIVGPHTGIIPGLSAKGEASIADDLDWTLEGFRKAFSEVSGKGMVIADWKAKVVWVPNAIKYNEPESPNVVRSWGKAWDEIPECRLKDQAFARLRDHINGMGEGFQKAFDEAFPKGSPNQEQEHEQEQDLPSAGAAGTATEKNPTAVSVGVREYWHAAFKRKHKTDYAWDGKKDGTMLADILKRVGMKRETAKAGERAMAAAERSGNHDHNLRLVGLAEKVIDAYLGDDREFYAGHPLTLLKRDIQKFLVVGSGGVLGTNGASNGQHRKEYRGQRLEREAYGGTVQPRIVDIASLPDPTEQ